MPSELKECREAFELAFDAAWNFEKYVFEHDHYKLGHKYASELNTDWIAFQKGWEARQTPDDKWLPASQAPYDTMCLFYTIDGNIVQGFIYDGDETDFGYTHFMPLPLPPERIIGEQDWLIKQVNSLKELPHGFPGLLLAKEHVYTCWSCEKQIFPEFGNKEDETKARNYKIELYCKECLPNALPQSPQNEG